jgi:hypothetical protein
MPAFFEPRLDVLPESQRRLWPELDAVPSDFVLYGGTGIAVQLGHRVSEDFDFFSSSGFDPEQLSVRLPFFRDLDPADLDVWVHRKRDNLEGFVDRGDKVKVASLAAWTPCSAWRTRDWQLVREFRSRRLWIWQA